MNDDLIGRGDVKTRICVAECAAPECWCVCNLMEAIDGTPAVDAVEVVRCRDCMMLQHCRFAQGLGLDGFCSQGERKNETD